MAKHSFEFKKKVVLEYLDGKGGVKYLSKRYGLGSDSQLRTWINAYNAFGDEGLMRSRKQTKYSFEKKISVVELYLSSEISYQDLAIQEGINNPSMIANWVNRFRAAGPDALKTRRKGRKKTLDKPQIDSEVQKAEERIFQSMSRKGNCHDNSVMENFFGLLKQEIYYGVIYYSYDELKSEIERYIKYYNEQRIKEKLGWLSPVQYRLRLLAA